MSSSKQIVPFKAVCHEQNCIYTSVNPEALSLCSRVSSSLCFLPVSSLIWLISLPSHFLHFAPLRSCSHPAPITFSDRGPRSPYFSLGFSCPQCPVFRPTLWFALCLLLSFPTRFPYIVCLSLRLQASVVCPV